MSTLQDLLRIIDNNTFNNVYGVTSRVVAKNVMFIDSGDRGSLEASFDDSYNIVKLSKDRFPVKIAEDILIKSIEKAMNHEVSVIISEE